MTRLPFDALCAAAVVSEAQSLLGAQVTGVGAPSQSAVALVLRRGTDRGVLVLSAAVEYPCAFVLRERLDLDKSDFSERLGRHLKGKELSGIRQLGFDRAVEVAFEPGSLRLFAFLFGTHANLVLATEEGKVITTLRKADAFRVGSVIAVESPRVGSLSEALERRDAGASAPLLLALERHGAEAVLRSVAESSGYVHPEGAYPLPLSPEAERSESFSTAVAAMFTAVERERVERRKEQAVARLKKAIEAKERALAQVQAAIRLGDRARDLQVQAELLLAYQHQVPEGATEFRAVGYDGEEVVIPLDPKLTPVENAERLFAKARRAKLGRTELLARRNTLQREVQSLRQRLESPDIEEILTPSHQKPKRREDRPYEGQKIRETQDPRGFVVLWGMNAEANDYLTRRVAKPNDLWLHARGATGAHVVIRTNNQPERVPRDTLLFAAHIAARNSSQKHASLVPVAYTLAKYVRRPRHAPPGTVELSREKVLFVRPELRRG
jgi:predicted ribosome quality control (RQC) complex YloA/Tae2 family protein